MAGPATCHPSEPRNKSTPKRIAMLRAKATRLAFCAAAATAGFALPAAAQVDDRLSRPVTPTEERREESLTDLLNQLARQGFADLRSIRPENGSFVVEVVDRELAVRQFRLDPESGTITEIP
jgi:hypothetical protein